MDSCCTVDSYIILIEPCYPPIITRFTLLSTPKRRSPVRSTSLSPLTKCFLYHSPAHCTFFWSTHDLNIQENCPVWAIPWHHPHYHLITIQPFCGPNTLKPYRAFLNFSLPFLTNSYLNPNLNLALPMNSLARVLIKMNLLSFLSQEMCSQLICLAHALF